MTGKTGQKCVSAGKYHCQTHPASTVTVKVGAIFPPVHFRRRRYARCGVGERGNDLIGTEMRWCGRLANAK
jgi:hypothetical protein